FFFSSRRRHTRFSRDWSSDVCSSDLEAVKKAADIVEKGPFYHAYLPSFSATQVSNIVRKYHLKYKIEAFFFDYIKMPLHGDSRLQEYQLLGQLTGVLKDLAGELEVPCVTAAQLN